jgi:hypothetical protein
MGKHVLRNLAYLSEAIIPLFALTSSAGERVACSWVRELEERSILIQPASDYT